MQKQIRLSRLDLLNDAISEIGPGAELRSERDKPQNTREKNGASENDLAPATLSRWEAPFEKGSLY